RSEAYFVFPLAQGTPGKQCGLAATGVYQPSLRSPWLAAPEDASHGIRVSSGKIQAILHTDGSSILGIGHSDLHLEWGEVLVETGGQRGRIIHVGNFRHCIRPEIHMRFIGIEHTCVHLPSQY
ncbi:hypothetical protein, partial [Thiolapillus sp.]|uniref:hypothetical protein n=1 Tax=Thiolapillus sp. TaxID=2017437 RepID=UPI0025D0DF94